MPGLLPTQFESKMREQGFTDLTGKIIKGVFKDSGLFISEYDRDENGNLVLGVGRFMNLEKPLFFVVIPKEQMTTYMQTQNLLELTVFETACQHVIEPIERYIVSTAANLTQEIYKNEQCDLFDDENSLDQRRKNAINFYSNKIYVTPKRVLNPLSTMPKSVLENDSVLSIISKQLFLKLSEDAQRFDTPEAEVSFRTITSQTIKDLIKNIEKKHEGEHINGIMSFDKDLKKFDKKFEKEGSNKKL